MVNGRGFGFFLTLILALMAGGLFSAAGMVIPWLLGPLLIVIMINTLFSHRIPLYWPGQLRNAGLVIVGIQLGASVTTKAAHEMAGNLPYMVLMTFLLIGFSLLLAFLIAKITGVSASTALLGSFPGGLSQMVIVGEEMDRANEAIVAFMQTIRILLVVISVPMAAKLMYGSDPSASLSKGSGEGLSMEVEILFLLLLVGPVAIWIGKKIQMPVPYMLIPLLIVAISQITIVSGSAIELPKLLVNAAQLCIGAHLGYSMNINKSFFTVRMVGATIISNLVLILFCFGLSEIFSLATDASFKNLFLAAAPGGITEMSITALSIHADAAFVTSFQLFRVLFILLVVTPMMKWLLLRKETEKMEKSV